MDNIQTIVEHEDLDLLRQMHADNYDFKQNYSKILRDAVLARKTNVVELIAPWSDPTVHHNDPLVLASQYGYLDIVKILFPYSTSVLRALVMAGTNNHNDCFEYLVTRAQLSDKEAAFVVNHFVSANCLDAVEFLIPFVNMQTVYTALKDENVAVFEQIIRDRQNKILTAEVGDASSIRKMSKI